ncbi:MAG: thioredoxin family protein [Chloroflexi bacterium]|nr:thioredoxin family protein [Chloroflexota bacterium]
MIPLKEQDEIRLKFAQELIGPVKIDYFTETESALSVPGKTPCPYCKPTRQMLQELANLSDLVSLRVHLMDQAEDARSKYGIERVPATVLRGLNGQFVKYYGIPSGTEFPALVESIVDISRKEVLLSLESQKALKSLEKDVSIRVFVTPTCGYCPQMVHIVYQMALASDKIHAEVIEVTEFPDLAEKYQVQAVPLTVINNAVAIPGAVPEPQLMEQIIKASESTIAPPSSLPAGDSTPTPQPEVKRGEQRSSGLYIP